VTPNSEHLTSGHPIRQDSPRTHSARNRCVALPLFLMTVVLASTAGCKSPTHEEAKVQAEHRWSKVRGQVKTQLARQQFERGLFEDAVKTLKEATALDPTSTEAFAMLAKANLELGKVTTAEQVLTRAEKAGLVSADLHYLKGVVLEQRNELEVALEQHEKAGELDPSKANYIIAQIEVLVALNRVDEALKLTDANINRFDDEASLAVLGARIAALKGDTQEALRRLQHPSVLNANDPVTIEQLAVLLAGQNQCSEAIRLVESLIEKSGDSELSGDASRSVATCYMKQNEPHKAVNILSARIKTATEDDATQALLARAALSSGEYMVALRAVEAVRTSRGRSHETDLLLATVLWKNGNLVDARELLQELLSQDPSDVDGWCLLGEVYQDQAKPEQSREAFERALELDPSCRWASLNLPGSGQPRGQ
jgi:Tfp pilus assembly protein PilF